MGVQTRLTAEEIEAASLSIVLTQIDVVIAESRKMYGGGHALIAVAKLADEGLIALTHKPSGRRIGGEEFLSGEFLPHEVHAEIAPLPSGTKNRKFRQNVRAEILRAAAARGRAQKARVI